MTHLLILRPRRDNTTGVSVVLGGMFGGLVWSIQGVVEVTSPLLTLDISKPSSALVFTAQLRSCLRFNAGKTPMRQISPMSQDNRLSHLQVDPLIHP